MVIGTTVASFLLKAPYNSHLSNIKKEKKVKKDGWRERERSTKDAKIPSPFSAFCIHHQKLPIVKDEERVQLSSPVIYHQNHDHFYITIQSVLEEAMPIWYSTVHLVYSVEFSRRGVPTGRGGEGEREREEKRKAR